METKRTRNSTEEDRVRVLDGHVVPRGLTVNALLAILPADCLKESEHNKRVRRSE